MRVDTTTWEQWRTLRGEEMKFIKLCQDGREFLVNLSNVSEVYSSSGDNKSRLYFNFAIGDEQESIAVDESIVEILEMV